ncbi:metallophosphoesterase [Flavobacterium wongokense]|uniref:metallophosphoesterase n=1 Tax=Flavobacterium wongokense TaxID=2910674 RepID=UPI001F449F49|nr:metallophosphoesterase [Flavobacterium sp. WG47]MCF6133374.1 metallophosphoesterase [Flavobacterium sp. WG47]
MSTNTRKYYKLTSVIFLFALLQSCATHKIQYNKNSNKSITQIDTGNINEDHTFYLIGDAGNAGDSVTNATLSNLRQRLEKADSNSTLIFLGDNIYPVGMPADPKNPEYESAVKKINRQLEVAKKFKGRTIFIPGNHDWYSGIEGLKAETKTVTAYLNKDAFQPKDNCAIEEIKINKNITLIVIDSQWFLEDWEKSPKINDDCSIKTREAFFEELESILNKNQDKIKIIALHHPLFSNGSHGGQFSWKKQLFPLESNFPLPIVGSALNFIRKTSGISTQDLQNKVYQAYRKRITALLQGQDNVIVVAGHDHNLQYLEVNNITQIISGAGSKSEAARAIGKNDFSYGGNGYTELTVDKNQEISIRFFGIENRSEKLLWQTSINKKVKTSENNYPNLFPKTISASVYTKEMTQKSMFHNWFLGSHYKDYYSTPIEARTVSLDTLFGGLKPLQAGGGHQSKSLRLKNNEGKEYVMRALKKSASRFLQSVAFKDQYVEKQFEDTYAENFLLDFYTTSHPYTPFVVGSLADNIGISHSNPQLYYVPKQNSLGKFNDDFGDELYMIEERPTDSQKELQSFGKPDAIVSTSEVLEMLHKNEKKRIDEKGYIRARLFDMLIGDWDRHFDQWRWGEYKEGEQTVYRPIPRDRDQAFAKYDGALLAIVMNIPDLRHMQTFKEKIGNLKWFNREPYPLDITFLKTTDETDWVTEAKFIQDNLSEAAIAAAFKNLPKEMQDGTMESIIAKLKIRKKDLQEYAKEYYKVLQKTIVIVGTEEKDKFEITRKSGNQTEIKQYRLKKEEEKLVQTRTISGKLTNEVWIYGLDEDDSFIVTGNEKSTLKIRLIGGQNHDNYTVQNGNNIVVYDFKSKKNTFDLDHKAKKILTDDYETNLYDYKKPRFNAWTGLPAIGYNPDDGVKIGGMLNYTRYGFKQNPYTQKHTFKAFYYFATNGFELNYSGKFPKLLGQWDFDIETRFTSPNFAINYFGYGNETVNDDEDFGMDYNRVKIQMVKVEPVLKLVGKYGSEIQFKGSFENIEVEQTNGRFINLPGIVNPDIFDYQQFAGGRLQFSFENYDNASNPTLGMGFLIAAGWKMNLNQPERNFSELEAKWNFNYKIDKKGKLVLASLFKGKAITNDNFEFYQGAVLGGDYDLRGFRNERFLGKQSFFNSNDIRLSLGKIKGSLLPMSYGILGGFDYGRVWFPNEDSNTWHRSYGGGLWLNGVGVITARLTYFKSEIDKARIAFGLGFGF